MVLVLLLIPEGWTAGRHGMLEATPRSDQLTPDIPDRRRATQQHGSQALARPTAAKTVSSPPVRTIPAASDVTDRCRHIDRHGDHKGRDGGHDRPPDPRRDDREPDEQPGTDVSIPLAFRSANASASRITRNIVPHLVERYDTAPIRGHGPRTRQTAFAPPARATPARRSQLGQARRTRAGDPCRARRRAAQTLISSGRAAGSRAAARRARVGRRRAV